MITVQPESKLMSVNVNQLSAEATNTRENMHPQLPSGIFSPFAVKRVFKIFGQAYYDAIAPGFLSRYPVTNFGAVQLGGPSDLDNTWTVPGANFTLWHSLAFAGKGYAPTPIPLICSLQAVLAGWNFLNGTEMDAINMKLTKCTKIVGQPLVETDLISPLTWDYRNPGGGNMWGLTFVHVRNMTLTLSSDLEYYSFNFYTKITGGDQHSDSLIQISNLQLDLNNG